MQMYDSFCQLCMPRTLKCMVWACQSKMHMRADRCMDVRTGGHGSVEWAPGCCMEGACCLMERASWFVERGWVVVILNFGIVHMRIFMAMPSDVVVKPMQIVHLNGRLLGM